MDLVDYTTVPQVSHAEIVARLRELHDDDADAILADTGALAEKIARYFHEYQADQEYPHDPSELACVMMLGALRARLEFFGICEEGADIACAIGIDIFNRTLAELRAAKTPEVLH